MYPQRPFGCPKSWEDTCLEEQAQDRKSKQQGNHLTAPSSSNAYRQSVREPRLGDQALCRSTVVISWRDLGHFLEFKHSKYRNHPLPKLCKFLAISFGTATLYSSLEWTISLI